MYNLSEVKFKFLGDKKGATKGYYLEVWKIDSVFLYQVYLLNYQTTVFIFVKVCINVRTRDAVN